jgi:hypothetical protein
MKEYEAFQYLSYSDSPWADIEAALSIDYKELFFDAVQYYYPDITNDSDSHWSDLDVDIEVMTRFIYAFTGDCFFEWLSQLNFNNVHADLALPKDATFINFNYTDTLQRLYSIPEKSILHIHGLLNSVRSDNCIGHDVFSATDIESVEALGPTVEKDKWNNDFIREVIQFGASDISVESVQAGLEKEYGDDDFYGASIEPAIRTLLKFVERTTKNIFRNNSVLQDFIAGKDIDEVILMGPSFGPNDDPYYMEILLPAFYACKWTFMLFKDKDGFNEQRIHNFIKRVELKNYRTIEW